MAEKTKQTTEYTIDASKRSLGRVASEAASILMGKNTTEFQRYKAPSVSVTIENAAKTNISEKKKREKTYVRYTGYPGGKREETLAHSLDKKGYEDIYRKAVYGMLPSNKLRPGMMKNLYIVE